MSSDTNTKNEIDLGKTFGTGEDGEQKKLLVTASEVRSNGEMKLYFDRVLNLFRKSFPKTPMPDLHFNISPIVDNPFACYTSGNSCILTPLILGTSTAVLKKMYTTITPGLTHSKRRLTDTTDDLYFTPERTQFLLAKALCERSAKKDSVFSLLKLSILKYSPERYLRARRDREVVSDAMAVKLSADIAVGGLEHLAKLYHYNTIYHPILSPTDESFTAGPRLLDLLETVQQEHDITRSDALRLALNNRTTLSGSSREIARAVEQLINTKEMNKELKKYNTKNV